MPSTFSSKLKNFLSTSCSPRSGSDPPAIEPTEEQPPEQSTKEAEPNGHGPQSSGSSNSDSSDGILKELRALNLKNIGTLKDVALAGIDGEPINDKTYLMERIVQLAAGLPVSSRSSATLTNAFLNQLWTDLQHPPHSYLGKDFLFRQADGSNNNIMWPNVGAAGQPYARSVQPRQMQPVARPDPGVVFDAIMARKQFTPHPSKISSVLFYLASIIIHDIFHTSHEDFSISETSSYLDLAPLYGSSEDEQKAVRTLRDGKLKPDCFSDSRILGFPPGVGVLLIMFNRFHNHVVENLAKIDENGRFSRIRNPPGRPPPADADALYDEALFQTGRLVTTGLYVNIILKDYVRTILNLNRVDSLWNLDPRSEEGKALFGHKIPEATGNSVSAEFNLVYRWHSCISQRDEQWTQDAYKALFGEQQHATLSDFLMALRKWAAQLPSDPQKRPFANLERIPELGQKYSDESLAEIWTASVKDVAGRFGANHVPEILRDVEILGIIQARSWNLASLNEFRSYFKLQPYKKFEDINPDPAVVEQLRNLYGDPDHVEIYPGILVESTKEPKFPGSGLCTTFTISRAVLSDAVALVRGDRFYTVDYTPNNLTNWGFNEVDYDLSVNYGCVLYKLVLTALPTQYRQNSIYAHYPLVIPEENLKILNDLKIAAQYDFDDPAPLPVPAVVKTYASCKAVLGTDSGFETAWDPAGLGLSPIHLSGSAKSSPSLLARKLLDNEEWGEHARALYQNAISELIPNASYPLAGARQVDIVRDVFNVVHVKLVASLFFLPVRTKGTDRGTYDGPELLDLLNTVFAYTGPKEGPAHRFASSHKRQKAVQLLAKRIEDEVDAILKKPFVPGIVKAIHKHPLDQIRISTRKVVEEMGRAGGLSAKEIALTQILPLAATLVIRQSQSFAESINYLLGKGQKQLQEVKELAGHDARSLANKLESYALELSRITVSSNVARKAVSPTTIEDGGKSIHVVAGQVVVCDLTSAAHDGAVFSQPDEFVLDRDLNRYTSGEFGDEISLANKITKITLPAALEAVMGLQGLTKAPGLQGELRAISGGDSTAYLNIEESNSLSYPSSMKVNWHE